MSWVRRRPIAPIFPFFERLSALGLSSDGGLGGNRELASARGAVSSRAHFGDLLAPPIKKKPTISLRKHESVLHSPFAGFRPRSRRPARLDLGHWRSERVKYNLRLRVQKFFTPIVRNPLKSHDPKK